MSEPRPAFAARVALCFALVLVLPGGAQNGVPGPRTPLSQPPGQHLGGLEEMGNGDSIDQERRLRALNADRQKSMVSDTDKLLKLANELNIEVAAASPESLNSDQLHKVAQIEKLAHSVREKMSTSVRGTPAYHPPPTPIMR